MLTARPQRPRGRDVWLPKCNSIRTGQRAVPEIYFRILHIADDGRNGFSGTEFHKQAVEIALGPNGAFQGGNVAVLMRRVATKRVLTATPARRPKSTSRREPRTPRVVELLRKALEWQAQLESGDIANQAAIAAREGITRARVTQIMALLKLAPEIQQHIMSMPETLNRPKVTERLLRPIAQVSRPTDQCHAFRQLLNC